MQKARDTLSLLVIVGLTAVVLGSVIAGLSWPDEETPAECISVQTGEPIDCDEEAEASGSVALTVLGLGLGGLGGAVLQVGLIGYGVMLGSRAGRENPAPAA